MPLQKLIIIVGKPKVWKTVSTTTFPKPMKWYDFDDGIKTFEYTKTLDGKGLLVPDFKDIEIIKCYKEGRQKMIFETDMHGKKPAPPDAKLAYDVLMRFEKDLDTIVEGKYKTVVIDSLTAMFRIWKSVILQVNGRNVTNLADYGTLETNFYERFLPSIKSLPVDFIILIDHVELDKDELSGRLVEFPIGTSRPMGMKMSQAFDEVWLQTIDGGKAYWNTINKGFFEGAGSRTNLPQRIEANYEALKPYLPTQSLTAQS
jgi:hypothetical protein